jgi:oxygen-dependent protoporphyrinogen oxidase
LRRVEVAIVGGGIAGLACAHALLGAGMQDLIVLEAGARCGGPIESARRASWLIERGPITVRGTRELLALFRTAGIEPLFARRAAPLVASGGRLVALPPSIGELLGGAWVPLPALFGLLCEPLRRPRPGPRSVHELVAERFGNEIAARAADLLTLGSFGAPAERVGFESAFPDFADALEQVGGRLTCLALRRGLRRESSRAPLVSGAEGLAALPERLARGLGERQHTGSPVRRVCIHKGSFELEHGPGEQRLQARRVVLALPPARLASLIELPGAGNLLESFPTTPQTLVHFALEDAGCAERWTGLGFLAPTREGLPLLGCLFPSNLFPGRAPRGALLLSVFAGPVLQGASDLDLARELAPVLRRLLGSPREPELLDVARHPLGIPLYDREHRARLGRLRAATAAIPGLQLAGWGYDGIGLGAAAASGARAAHALY